MLEHFISYGLEGALWVLSFDWILTKFFGCRTKKDENRTYILAAVIVMYAVGAAALYAILSSKGRQAGAINGLLVLFDLIYWAFHLKDIGKTKKCFYLLFTAEVCVSVANLVYSLFWMLGIDNFLVSAAVLGLIYLLSWFSSRNRKEPMRFSLAASTVVFCFFLDMVMDFFQADASEEILPIVRFRTVLEGVNDTLISTLVYTGILTICILFVVMVVKESESDYFQKKNAQSEYCLESQKLYYEGLMESNRQIRKLKHDMKNHLAILSELNEQGQYGQLSDYLEQINGHISQADSTIRVGNEIADAVLNQKREALIQNNIDFQVEGSMEGFHMAALDVCTLFANMMDNAIEAVKELPEQSRKMKIEIRKSPYYLFITQTNPTKDKLIVEDNRIATTKKEKGSHGFGLQNMADVTEKYEGQFKIKAQDNEFQLEIMLPLG